MRRRRMVVVFAVACALGACRRRESPVPPPRKPVLGPITVDDVTSPSEAPAGVDPTLLEQGLRDRLLASGLFAAGETDAGVGPVTRVRATIGVEAVEVGAKGEAHAHVRLRLDTRPADAPGALSFDLEGQGVAPYAVPPRPSRRERGGAVRRRSRAPVRSGGPPGGR